MTDVVRDSMRPLTGEEDSRHCFVVAEVAQTHDGSLGLAHSFIDAIARTGADAIKFQTHIADEESTPDEPWRVRFSPQDESRYDYWRRMEFSPEQWLGLKQHCDQVGVHFMSSAFSEAAVDLLQKIGVVAWKVASGEVANLSLIKAMATSRDPVILSSGLSTLRELDRAVAVIREAGAPVAVLQCTTEYPTTEEHIGLNMLEVFRERWQCPVGLSDHSGTPFPGLAAVSLGAEVIEVHVTLSREMFGPDVAASLTTDELALLVRGVRFIERALDHPVRKDDLAHSLAGLRRMFGRSLVLRRPVPRGATLAAEDLIAKKPGTGVHPTQIDTVVGRRVRRSLPADHILREADLL